MASRLHLYPLDFQGHVPPPPPSLNGGLFTGEAFHKGAPYGNVPVMPDGAYMHTVNLLSAKPPTEAVYQPPPGAAVRPGNSKNDHPLPHFNQYRPQNNLFCANVPGEETRCLGTADQTPAAATQFAKYAAW